MFYVFFYPKIKKNHLQILKKIKSIKLINIDHIFFLCKCQ